MKQLLVLLLLLLIACSQTAQPILEQPPLKPLTGPMPTGTATTQDGQTIAYQLYPNRPGSAPVILLHMLKRSRTDWDSIANWLNKNGYTVIVPDLRGHGQSTGMWEEFTNEDFNRMTYDVAAMKSVLENQGANISKLSIIGASIGANVAMSFAQNDKDTRTIVLLSPGFEYRGINIATMKFNKPFLVVASADDPYSMQTAQELRKNNPSGEIMLYQDAGHGTNMFVKNDLAPTILEWLRKHTY